MSRRTTEAVARALCSDAVPDAAEMVWQRHRLLCPHDDERCDHVEELVEALVLELEGADDRLAEKVEEAVKEASKEAADAAEERLKEEHAAEVEDLEGQLEELRKLSDVDRKTAALSEGRREAEVELLGRLREMLAGPAKELRKEAHGLVVELIRRVNEKGVGT